MSIIISLSEIANTIDFEFYENTPLKVYSLCIFLFNFVKISYKYTYVDVPTSKYFSLWLNET